MPRRNGTVTSTHGTASSNDGSLEHRSVKADTTSHSLQGKMHDSSAAPSGGFSDIADVTKKRMVNGGFIGKKSKARDLSRQPFLSESDVHVARKKMRMSNARYWLVQSLLLVAVVVSVGWLALYYSQMSGADAEMYELTTEYTVKVDDSAGIDESLLPPLVDWDGLQSVNEEISGWLRIPNSTVDYCVMTTPVKEKYLRRDIYGNYSINGCLFTDWTNESDYSQEHIVIYGHHLPWPAMFHDVSRYIEEPGYFDDHRKMYLETPTTTYELTAVGVYKAQENEYQARQTQFGSTEDFNSYLDERLGRCDYVYKDDVERRTMDKLVTLITCTDNGEARCIVECVVTASYPTSYVPNVRAYMSEQYQKNKE